MKRPRGRRTSAMSVCDGLQAAPGARREPAPLRGGPYALREPAAETRGGGADNRRCWPTTRPPPPPAYQYAFYLKM